MKKIIRVFPRKTNATPTDSDVRIRKLPLLSDEADEIHISVAFSWDIEWAANAALQWEQVAPVSIGGPAYREPGGEFTPGLYLKEGYVITSRGCNNRCWFCSVPEREGFAVREIQVTEGWILCDDNILACSQSHIDEVFDMLSRQKEKPSFAGGLEAALLTESIAARLRKLKPKSLFFAYDTTNDLEPLYEAGRMLLDAGFTKASNTLRCYVLIGFKGDTEEKALKRLKQSWDAGFMPFAMLYRDKNGNFSDNWKKFQRQWANPVITACNCKRFDSY